MDMNADQTLDKLKQILIQDLDLNLRAEELHGKIPLFEGGLALDSVVAVELISAIENRFKIELPEEILKMNAFRDLDSVVGLIQQQLTLQHA